MRILVLTASLPYPPASGGALRGYGILHGLHQAGHDVMLLTFHDGTSRPEETPLAGWCRQIITLPSPLRSKLGRLRDVFLSSQADIARRLYSPEFEAAFMQLARENDFDLIQFEGIEVACYLPIARRLNLRAKLCFDTFNAEADLQRRIFEIDRTSFKRLPAAIYSYIQGRRITRYEGNLCRIADYIVAVSPEDAALLQQYQPQKPVAIVPSGIFVDDYTQLQASISLPAKALVFTGKMDYRPNVDAMLWFVESILPRLTDTHLIIVGQKPHARIQQLAQQTNVTLTGWVKSVLPYLHAADVYVAPLRMGSGTRLKILEAMASGCAIVATSAAAAGLSDDAKAAMKIADDEMSFAAAVRDLLNDAAQRQQLGMQAQKVVRVEYDWSVLIPRLLAVYGD